MRRRAVRFIFCFVNSAKGCRFHPSRKKKQNKHNGPHPRIFVVIGPPQNIIDHVAVLKKRLKEHIGWFGSANTQAHLTVFNFDATETELETWKKKIQQYCDTVIPLEVIFEHFDAFPPHTFFFALDDASTDYLNNMIKDFQRSIGVKPQTHAHMSLARSLGPERLEQTKRYSPIKM